MADGFLRRDAASPEDGNFSGLDGHGVAEVRPLQIMNAQGFRGADLDGGAMGQTERGAQRRRPLGLIRSHGTHGYDQVAPKPSRRCARLIRAKHGYVSSTLQMPHGKPGIEQGLFEGERTTQKKGDEIVPPTILQVGQFRLDMSMLEEQIQRDIGAEVRIGRDVPWMGRPRIGHVQQRARPGIAMTEQKKVKRPITWKNDQVSLNVAKSQAGRGAGPLPCADGLANLGGRSMAKGGHGAIVMRSIDQAQKKTRVA